MSLLSASRQVLQSLSQESIVQTESPKRFKDVVQKEVKEARNSLKTVDEYVGKIKNRVDYLSTQEEKMAKKMRIMADVLAKRDQIIH